jgi:drug/metabolite transporter (DMT)-like permease
VPLFTIVVAHFMLQDDRMTRQRVLGLLVGFAGAAILFSENIQPDARNPFIGQAAVLLAAIFYAGSSVYARKATAHIHGVMRGAGPFPAAVIGIWLVTPAFEAPLHMPVLPLTWIALLWLGALGSGLALILWYYLLHEIGPTRTTLVTYVFPLGGVALGVIFLGEPLSWQLLVGAALIISSIAVVNWRHKTT